METLLLQAFYLLRPILSANWFEFPILGFSSFELFGLALLALLGAALASSLMSKFSLPISAMEVWATMLILWVLLITVAYPDLSEMGTAARWIVPLFTFIALRRVLLDRFTLVPLLYLLLLGFLIPFAASTNLTVRGEGLEMVVFWTGTERYRGVYSGIHEMGHNAAFAMMLVVIYIAICKSRSINVSIFKYLILAAIFLSAAYLLLHTHLRTAYIGLAVFSVVGAFFFGIRYLVVTLLVSGILLAWKWPAVSAIFFDVLDPQYTGEEFDRAGSGRIGIWRHNLEIWLMAPLEHKIAGLGVGNNTGSRTPSIGDPFPQVKNSHNDWLKALLELGVVGFGILAGLFWAIWRRILQLDQREKAAFMGVFAAVVVMNFLSNSYLERMAMAQLFFMVMVYVDLDDSYVAKASFERPLSWYNEEGKTRDSGGAGQPMELDESSKETTRI